MSLLRTVTLRAPFLTAAGKRVGYFSTSQYARKDSGSAVKDTIDSVNKAAGDAAVKGIEKGQQASSTIKSAVGINANKAEGSAEKLSGQAQGKASELAGEAKGKTKEVFGGEAQGKASELAGEAKGKTKEVMGEAKGKAEEVKGKL